jgi:hypothetical protein
VIRQETEPLLGPGIGASSGSDHRVAFLQSLGAHGSVLDELLAYTTQAFVVPDEITAPLPDEPSVSVWEEYAADAERRGAVAALVDRLVQLRFPIESAMSGTPAYQRATRRGDVDDASLARAIAFRDPAGVRVFIHATAAGRVPVIVARDRADFVAFVQALVHKNEPTRVPDAMGAVIVGGYNNWDRVARLRERWAADHPVEALDPQAWTRAFSAIVPQKALYQDRFIVLSAGPYSGVPANVVGLEPEEWVRTSLTLRLEHECAHYYTRRVFGSMRNGLHDELVADHTGIVAAIGRFRADWFLAFMGLEAFPAMRSTGRLHTYRGTPALSDEAFAVLQVLVLRVARTLEAFEDVRKSMTAGLDPLVARARTIHALSAPTIEEIAAPTGVATLAAALRAASQTVMGAADGPAIRARGGARSAARVSVPASAGGAAGSP